MARQVALQKDYSICCARLGKPTILASGIDANCDKDMIMHMAFGNIADEKML